MVGGMTFGSVRALAHGGSSRRAGDRGQPVVDRGWPGRARAALGCAAGFTGVCVALDWASGGLTGPRIGLWTVLGCVVCFLLLPPRVAAGNGWLSVRTGLRVRRVRTDALRAVESSGALDRRLVLRDVHGGRVVLDARVPADNPLLRHLLDAGVRRSLDRGTLRSGADVLLLIARRADERTAGAVLRASGVK